MLGLGVLLRDVLGVAFLLKVEVVDGVGLGVGETGVLVGRWGRCWGHGWKRSWKEALVLCRNQHE